MVAPYGRVRRPFQPTPARFLDIPPRRGRQWARRVSRQRRPVTPVGVPLSPTVRNRYAKSLLGHKRPRSLQPSAASAPTPTRASRRVSPSCRTLPRLAVTLRRWWPCLGHREPCPGVPRRVAVSRDDRLFAPPRCRRFVRRQDPDCDPARLRHDGQSSLHLDSPSQSPPERVRHPVDSRRDAVFAQYVIESQLVVSLPLTHATDDQHAGKIELPTRKFALAIGRHGHAVVRHVTARHFLTCGSVDHRNRRTQGGAYAKHGTSPHPGTFGHHATTS